MKTIKPYLLTAFAAMVLAGCAQNLPAVAYVKSSNPVHSITLVTPYVSDQPALVQGELNSAMSETPLLGGAVAALIIGGVEMHRQDKVDALVAAQGFSPENELNTDLSNALKAKGYAVVFLPVPRPNGKFLTVYPAAQTDAYLDVTVPSYGYGQQGTAPYGPILGAEYKLVSVKDNQIFMQGSVAYTGSGTGYQFSGYSDFSTDPTRMTAGLRDELSEVATAVVSGLQ